MTGRNLMQITFQRASQLNRALQGQCFEIDLDEAIGNTNSPGYFDIASTAGLGVGFIGDTQEGGFHRDTKIIKRGKFILTRSPLEALQYIQK